MQKWRWKTVTNFRLQNWAQRRWSLRRTRSGCVHLEEKNAHESTLKSRRFSLIFAISTFRKNAKVPLESIFPKIEVEWDLGCERRLYISIWNRKEGSLGICRPDSNSMKKNGSPQQLDCRHFFSPPTKHIQRRSDFFLTIVFKCCFLLTNRCPRRAFLERRSFPSFFCFGVQFSVEFLSDSQDKQN